MTTAEKAGNQNTNTILDGALTKAVWTLSWPLMVRMAAVSTASFTDILIAGRMGPDTQAAIGICAQIWFLFLMLTIALSAGTTALVSRFWGAEDRENAVEAARHSLAFATAFGIITITLGLLAARPLLRMLGASALVEEIAWSYIEIDILSQLPFTIVWIAHSISRATGDTRGPMKNWVIMTALIVSLDLAFCVYPLQTGVRGIALAWLISSLVGVVLALKLIAGSELRECLSLTRNIEMGFSRQWLERILKIGLPACVTDLAWSAGCFALLLIFASTAHPTQCQASWAIGLRMEEIVSYMPIYALSTAVATIVGQNLGAGKLDRASRAGWLVCAVGIGITTLVSLILYMAASPLAALLSGDRLVVAYTTQYFQIIGLSQPFAAAWIILFGAMQGAGYTQWPMWASVIGLAVIRLPLAFGLTRSMPDGPAGCWIAFAVTSVALGIVAAWKYRGGKWQLQTV